VPPLAGPGLAEAVLLQKLRRTRCSWRGWPARVSLFMRPRPPEHECYGRPRPHGCKPHWLPHYSGKKKSKHSLAGVVNGVLCLSGGLATRTAALGNLGLPGFTFARLGFAG
jgi:hypothetical protein